LYKLRKCIAILICSIFVFNTSPITVMAFDADITRNNSNIILNEGDNDTEIVTVDDNGDNRTNNILESEDAAFFATNTSLVGSDDMMGSWNFDNEEVATGDDDEEDEDEKSEIADITINKTRSYITIGGKDSLNAEVTPSNAKNKKVIWESSNENIVTVNQKGNITGINIGTAFITATTEEGNHIAYCAVGVEEKITKVKGISLNKKSATISTGEMLELIATTLPEYATNRYILWSSSDETIATADWDGIVTGKGEGTTTITATTLDGGYTATCKVDVRLSSHSTDKLNTVAASQDEIDYERYLSSPYDVKENNHESIDIKTGNLSFERKLLHLPGRNGLDLDISIYYNSLNANFGDIAFRYNSKGKVVNYVDKTTALEETYKLGAGWSFNMPFIEKIKDEESGYYIRYLHFGNGEIYRIHSIATENIMHSNLYGHKVKDMMLHFPVEEFTNNKTTSYYRLMYKDGRKTYFDRKGKLIGKADRYGNTIKFTYPSSSEISITDTLGRITKIKYISNSSYYGDDYKIVNIIAPGDTEADPTCTILLEDAYRAYLPFSHKQEYVLRAIRDELAVYTYFDYDREIALFTFDCENDVNYEKYYFANLKEIKYPNHGKSLFTYRYDEFRIYKDKASSIKGIYKINTREEQEGDEGSKSNKLTYNFGRRRTSNVLDNNNVIKYYRFTDEKDAYDNYKNYLETETVKYATNNKLLKETAYQYKYDLLPIKQTTVMYGYTGDNITSGKGLTTEKSWDYNDYGDLLKEVNELGQETKCTYDPKFHQLTSIQQKIDKTHTKKTEFTIDSSNGNVTAMKQNHYEDGGKDKSIITRYHSYDSYGNLLKQSITMEDGTVIEENYQYSSDYKQGYLTKKWGTVTDYEGKKKTVNEAYTYYFNTGKLKSATDGNNHKTSYEYDRYSKLTKETNHDKLHSFRCAQGTKI